MDNLQIFEKAVSVLAAGANIALVTVVATTGSTPGKTGYKMLVFGAGRDTVGTVGGGLVEAEMIKQAGKMLAEPGSRIFRFDLGDTPDDEKGICGGSVELLIETFNKDALPLFKDLAAVTARDEHGVFLSIIAPDELPRKILIEDVEQVAEGAGVAFSQEVVSAIKEVAAAGQGAVKVSAEGMDAFIESVAQPPTVVIFGAGHLSGHVAQYAKLVGFRVTVYDDRQEYANRARFTEADNIIVEDFGRVLGNVQIDARSYVVIVTRGHKFDEVVLAQMLKTEARYIGMIGSKRKTRTILDKLGQKGFSDEALDKVYSPIGLSIGAVTPEEIALSIVGELVKIRRSGDAAPVDHLTLSRSGGSA